MTIKTKPATEAYRDNWDAIFKKAAAEEAVRNTDAFLSKHLAKARALVEAEGNILRDAIRYRFIRNGNVFPWEEVTRELLDEKVDNALKELP